MTVARKVLLLTLCLGILGWAWWIGPGPLSPIAAILALVSSVLLELRATPLASGYFSPASCWVVALSCVSSVGLPWALLCVACAIASRVLLVSQSPNGAVSDWVADFLPAALVAVGVSQLGLVNAAPVYFVAAIPLPLLLSSWLAPHSTVGKTRKALLQEHLTMVLLGPIAVVLGRTHWALMLLVWPAIFSLLRAASTGAELTLRRNRHLALTKAQREVSQQEQRLGVTEERQLQRQRLLDARADTFALLEELSAQPLSERQALEEALKALREKLPGAQCVFLPAGQHGVDLPADFPQASDRVRAELEKAWTIQLPWLNPMKQGTEAAWPLPNRGLVWILCPREIGAELQQTLTVYFRYLHVMLERVRFQEKILLALNTEATLRQDLTVAVTRLRALLGGASELALLVQPREILELAVARAHQWTGGRPCGATLTGIQVGQPIEGGLVFSLGAGEFRIHSEGLEQSEHEALQLWAILVAGALERCQAQATLIHGSKLAAIGQLAAGVAHELNTPLGAISVAIGVAILALEKKPERANSRLQIALKAVDQMRSIVAKLLNYSRDSGGRQKRVSLSEVVQDTVQLVDQSFQLEGIELVTRLEDAMVCVNAGEIQQVLVNLLVNARQAVSGKELPQVTIEMSKAGQNVIVQVSDNGPGVPEEVAERIFEPFFSTKELGQGVGLGLSISREIIVAHQGELHYQPVPTGGACFQLSLPISEE